MLENLPNNIFSSINEFHIMDDQKPLGMGSFGVVRRARHRMSGRQYAIKIITIDHNIGEIQLLLLSREISVHYSLDHPHIIKLWAVLSSGSKIYMVMDCAENGSLFKLLVKRKGLPEEEAFKYFYQVTDALEYMHKRNVFHRDIKVSQEIMQPQNILLDGNMNVKICDFGWVADEIHRKRNTFCGTYEYMSPEMVNEKKYDYKIDIWALGILLYELAHCKAPFPAKNVEELKLKFSEGIYEIKQKLSDQYKKLMVSLLQFQPKKRIEIHLIKKSPWMLKWANYPRESVPRGPSIGVLSSGIEKSTETPSTFKETKSGMMSKIGKTHKKYRTLQEEDLYCLKNSESGSRVKYATPRLNKQDSHSILSHYNPLRTESGELLRKQLCLKSHTRKESNDFLQHKFGKGAKTKSKFNQKQEKKKKISSKRSTLH